MKSTLALGVSGLLGRVSCYHCCCLFTCQCHCVMISCCHWSLPATRSLSACWNTCWSSALAFEVPARSNPRVSKPLYANNSSDRYCQQAKEKKAPENKTTRRARCLGRLPVLEQGHLLHYVLVVRG